MKSLIIENKKTGVFELHDVRGIIGDVIQTFKDYKELKRFADKFGFFFEQFAENKYCFSYLASHCITEVSQPLNSKSDIPDGAIPFTDLIHNGKDWATCYYTNDGKTIAIYRPNLNNKELN